MKKSILVISVLFIFYSCKEISDFPIPDGNTYYFENSQPINDSELKSIPNKFYGLYINSDSTYLNFQKDIITSHFYWKSKFSNTDLDSLRLGFDFTDDFMISKEHKDWKFSYRKLKDSIEISDKRIDTIFEFSNFQKMKRINGNLVISKKKSIYWNIKLLTLDKNNLVIKQLYSDSDLKKMDSITKVKSKMIDSTTFIISPSRSEFKQFFKLKDFGYDSEYKKVN